MIAKILAMSQTDPSKTAVVVVHKKQEAEYSWRKAQSSRTTAGAMDAIIVILW